MNFKILRRVGKLKFCIENQYQKSFDAEKPERENIFIWILNNIRLFHERSIYSLWMKAMMPQFTLILGVNCSFTNILKMCRRSGSPPNCQILCYSPQKGKLFWSLLLECPWSSFNEIFENFTAKVDFWGGAILLREVDILRLGAKDERRLKVHCCGN